MNSKITISIEKKESDKERCGYCLDRLYDEATWCCDACDTRMHEECHDELQSCVTMGCRNKVYSSDELRPVPAARRRRRRRRRTERGEPLSTEAKVLKIFALILLALMLIILVPITVTVLLSGLIFFLVSIATGDFSVVLGIFFGFGLSSAVLMFASYHVMKFFTKTFNDLRN